MVDGDFGKLDNAKLFAEQQGAIFDTPKFNELNAEIVRRVASIQIEASEAQIRGAKYQGLTLIVMVVAVLVTLAAPWIAPH